MIKYKILVLFLLVMGVVSAQGINLPSSIPSPTATSLGKYGDVPVNYYTGRANVDVPLFSLKSNNIPLNISLNYDTGGVRVGELPSWVGQNWNLSAGGVIVRTARGKGADEFKTEPGWPITSASGYTEHYSQLNGSNFSDPNYLGTLGATQEGAFFLEHDFAPDMFTFNFMGFTGKFFLGQDGQWKVQSDSNLKVEINLSEKVLANGRTTQCKWCYGNMTPPKAIGRIIMTDDNGNKYTFGSKPNYTPANVNAIEYSNQRFFDYSRTPTIASAWYLIEVADRLGNVVYTFTYEKGNYGASFYLNGGYTRAYKAQTGGWFDPGSGGCEYSIFSNLVEGSLIMPVYLKTISSPLDRYTITFNRSKSGYKYYNVNDEEYLLGNRFYKWYEQALAASGGNTGGSLMDEQLKSSFYLLLHTVDDVVIPPAAGESFGSYDTCGPFILGRTSYDKLDNIVISNNGTQVKTITMKRNTSLTERLNLTGVDILNGTATIPQTYRFDYNNFAGLPYYLSKAIDHWGYYKGTNFNHYNYGYFTMDQFALHYATREPDPAYLQIGSLKRITYPTKGFTDFEYEPHAYSKYVNVDVIANGQIGLTSENGIAGGLRIKKIINNDGVGETVKEFKYIPAINSTVSSGILSLKNKYWVDYYTNSTVGALYKERNFSINNLLPMANFSGSHIAYSTVFEVEPGKGYTQYKYTDYNDYADVLSATSINTAHSIFDERGTNDLKRGHLNEVNIYDQQNNPLKKQVYNYSTVGTYKARAYNYRYFHPCDYGDYVKEGNSYEVEYSDFKITSMVESDYLPGGTVSTTTANTYATLPVVSGTPYFGTTLPKTQTITTNTSETQSVQYNYPFNFSGTVFTSMQNAHFLPAVETLKSENSTVFSSEKTVYTTPVINGIARPMATSFQKSRGSEPYETLMFVDLYDNNGNILDYRLATNGPAYSFRYLYNQVAFKVEGAPSTETVNAGNFATFNNSLTKKATKYLYNAYRQLSSITYPNGTVETYTYDTNLRLEKIIDNNGKTVKKIEYNIK